MTNQAAIIDLGTNTWNLLIAESTDNGFKTIHSSKVAVKLAKGGISEGRINAEAWQRAEDAIVTHIKTLEEFNIPISRVKAFGTSAMRSLSNGRDLAEVITNKYGIQVNIIDGDEEAALIMKGVKKAVHISEKPYLVMDIGGGSTEFIIGIGSKTLWQKSTDLGVSRLFERFQPDDPINEMDIKMLLYHFQSNLYDLIDQLALYPISHLIGSSGSFESFASMILAGNDQTFDSTIRSMNIEMDELNHLIDKLIQSTEEQRLEWPGLVEMRVETIHIAALLVKYILRISNPDVVSLSQYALKEGAILSWLNELK